MNGCLCILACLVRFISPAVIDPLDPQAGDFLDHDLSVYTRTAEEAYSEGNYPLAVRYYLAGLSMNIDDEISIYNVACCYALMEEAYLAALYLQRAVIAGYRDMDHIRSDPDFDGVRDDPYFNGAVEHISAAIGEPQEYSGDRFMFRGEAAFPCLVRLPRGFDPALEYPLVVGLHGYGDSPENFIGLWEMFQRPDFIYACPSAPYPFMENNLTGYSWIMRGEDAAETARQTRLSTDYVMAAVTELKGRYRVSEVFLFGFSQGCSLTWMTGMYNPEEFAGLIGFAGGLDTADVEMSAVSDLSGLNVFAAGGTMDEAVDAQTVAAAAEILDDLGAETVFHSWEGVHAVSRSTLLQAQAWMESLRR